MGALEVGEQELSDGGRGHGEGDIGEAVGVGGRGGETVELVERSEGEAGFEGQAQSVDELRVGLGRARLQGEDGRRGPRLRVAGEELGDDAPREMRGRKIRREQRREESLGIGGERVAGGEDAEGGEGDVAGGARQGAAQQVGIRATETLEREEEREGGGFVGGGIGPGDET